MCYFPFKLGVYLNMFKHVKQINMLNRTVPYNKVNSREKHDFKRNDEDCDDNTGDNAVCVYFG